MSLSEETKKLILAKPLTPMQLSMLDLIRRHRPISTARLHDMIGVQRTFLDYYLRELIQRGLIRHVRFRDECCYELC